MCQFPKIKNGSRGKGFPGNKPDSSDRLDTSVAHTCLWLQPVAGLRAAREALSLLQSSEHMSLSTADSNRAGGRCGSKTLWFALLNYGGWENFKCQVNMFKMYMKKSKRRVFWEAG